MSYRDQIELHTALLRESPDPLYARFRELLSERGIDPSTSTLAESFPDDSQFEFGIVVTADRRVYQFGFDYLHKPVREGTFTEWTDLTNTWQSSNYSNPIGRAVRLLNGEPTGCAEVEGGDGPGIGLRPVRTYGGL